MNTRIKLLLTCATSALVIGTVSGAFAADMPVKAVPVEEGWWYTVYVEAGGRFFLNNPQKNGIQSQGGNSLAKYYEYSDIRPGPFGDFHLGTGSRNGLYQADVWARNIGYEDQSYLADLSVAGEHYLTLGWDQTPHVYSMSAITPYVQVGNHLVLPAGLSNKLFADCNVAGFTCGSFASPPTAQQISVANAIQRDLANSSHVSDIGIRRDMASVEYRWTPTDAWDVRANYTSIRRTGNQVEGVVFSPGTSGVVSQVAKPVADTTYNYGASGEYSGLSFWGQKYNWQVAYGGSTFKNDDDSYVVDNPFCPPGAINNTCARTGSASSPFALMSLAPDNQMNSASSTIGADLPWNSRYMGTVSYNMMRQNQGFLPFTLTPYTTTGGVPAGWTGGALPVNSVAGVAATNGGYTSLNGQINTLLVNNVVTTQITPDLKSKLYYRYYDYDNGTPEMLFRDWIVTDAQGAKATTSQYAPVQTLSISYTKQNAGAELNWRPARQWNTGVAYGYERYDWTRADVDVTNENTARAYVDYTPTGWVTARVSGLFSRRTFDNYNYVANVANAQWPTVAATYNPLIGGSTRYAGAYRQFLLDDRDRVQFKGSLAMELAPGFVITPTVGVKNDHYAVNAFAPQEGLTKDDSWNAGAEVAWVFNPNLTFLVSFMTEQYYKNIVSGLSINPTNFYTSAIQDRVNTGMLAVNYAVIPDKFDIKVSYTISKTDDVQPICLTAAVSCTSPAIPQSTAFPAAGQFLNLPGVENWYQRLDAMAKYRFDDDWVRAMGWKGTVTAKLRYAWERNAMTNWQNDLMGQYMYALAPSTGYMNWLAYDNPNYDVHLLAASLAWAW